MKIHWHVRIMPVYPVRSARTGMIVKTLSETLGQARTGGIVKNCFRRSNSILPCPNGSDSDQPALTCPTVRGL
jgi:hypothetical protein